MKKAFKKGFTLVELLVVIAILAILATVSIVGYTNFINKANRSVDEQFVTQINTYLEADEIVNGEPGNILDVKNILNSNDIVDFHAKSAYNRFYWVSMENRVIIWTVTKVGEDAGKVTYPEKFAKKYEALTEPSDDWKDINGDYNNIELDTTEGTLSEALLDAIDGAGIESDAVITFPKNSNLNLTSSELNEFNKNLVTENGVGKNVTIDLNGSSLDAERGTTIFDVKPGATLEITDGKMDVTSTGYAHAGFMVEDGASLILRNMEINALSYATFFPSSLASEIILENCVIKSDAYYGMMTNGMTSNNIRIVIKNTYFENDGSHCVLINVPSDVYIENSSIIGNASAVTMRAGSATIINSTLETKNENGGLYKWDTFTHFDSTYRYFGTGNAMAGGALVLGDHSKANDNGSFSYQGDITCNLDNVKLVCKNQNDLPQILIAARAEKKVTINYVNTTVDTLKLYDYPHPQGHGKVIVNGEEKTFINN